DARFAWLNPRGGRWDAPLDGAAFEPPALPGRELSDTRAAAAPPAAASVPLALASPGRRAPDEAGGRHESLVGSNSWAVAGSPGGRRGGHGRRDLDPRHSAAPHV